MKKFTSLVFLLTLVGLSGCIDMQQRQCLMRPGAPAATLPDATPPTTSCLSDPPCDGQ